MLIVDKRLIKDVKNYTLTPLETKLTKYANSGDILLDVCTLFNAH